MRKNKLFLSSLIIFAVAFFVSSIYAWESYKSKSQPTTSFLFKKIEKIYDGEIVEFLQKEKEYKLVLQKKGRQYRLIVNRMTGEVETIEAIESQFDKSKMLVQKDVEEKVKEKFPGKKFTVQLVKQLGETVYEATISQKSGDIKVLLNAQNGEIIRENKSLSKKVIISMKKAVEIARSKMKGIKVEHTKFVATASGGYYLVTMNDGEKRIVLQIHAASGEIVSTTIKQLR